MRQLKITNSITVREGESFHRYLREINKYEALQPEEEVVLAEKIQKGDMVAHQQLVNSNLKFVISVAKQYQGQGLPLTDLINEGNLGLMLAAHRFDSTRGFKFISFAVWWIRQHISQAIAEHGKTIRIPLNKITLNGKVRKAEMLLEQQLERQPSPEELSHLLEIDTEEVRLSLSYRHHLLSIDNPLHNDEDMALLDILENKDADKAEQHLIHNESLRTDVIRSFNVLSKRQKETLCYVYGIGIDHPLSLEEVAEKFELTKERVRQIKESALSKLRSMHNINLLRSYL